MSSPKEGIFGGFGTDLFPGFVASTLKLTFFEGDRAFDVDAEDGIEGTGGGGGGGGTDGGATTGGGGGGAAGGARGAGAGGTGGICCPSDGVADADAGVDDIIMPDEAWGVDELVATTGCTGLVSYP